MNMIKSYMELNWEPFMSDMCTILGFRSLLAQQSAKRCDDHHKSWAIFITFFLASLQELVVPYVRSCMKEKEDPTPAGFVAYASANRNVPNFSYMYDQVLKFALAIVNFRMGTRRNNSRLIRSGKYMFNSMFHGRKHPIYALIDVNDALIYHIAPEPVKNFISTNESCNKHANDKSSGQDADFMLEEANKETKSWIPRGVPDDKAWQTVCRNLPHLHSIKQKIEQLTGVATTGETAHRMLDVDTGVYAWRCRLREKEYLLTSELQHTTITGKKLHNNLVSFKRLAEQKRANHIFVIFNDDDSADRVAYDTEPVFITDTEANKTNSIEKQVVPEIKKRVSQDIRNLIEGNDNQKYFFAKFNRSKKKADLIQLYYEVHNFCSQQGVANMVIRDASTDLM